jgi:TetR/AcrR family transcriptional repressor of nem operon
MPRTADPTDIPERLLGAGLELFLRQGYNATGIQQITDQAGVPKGSFYNHFSSKETFGAAIVDRYEEFSRQSWQQMMRGAPEDPLAAIRHLFKQMQEHHARNGFSTGCLIGNFAAEIALASDVCRERLLVAQLAWRERLAGLISEGQKRGTIRDDIAAHALSGLTWSVWEGALLQMKVARSMRPLREGMTLILDRVYQPLTAPALSTPKRRRRTGRTRVSV